MPAKSKKQQRFMAAVANNPKFAKKVGVSQSVGEEFMKAKKYQKGGLSRRRVREGRGPSMEVPMRAPDREIPEEMPGFAPRRRNRAAAPMPGGPSRGRGMKAGGKVRGCGKATKGVRSAKMVSMKGS